MSEIKPAIRYSEAFKMQIVRELESGGINVDQIRRKYGVGGCHTIHRWVSKYGNNSLGKVIRVQKPEERNEQAELKRRVRALEEALADANLELALERQYTRLACERAGIKDVLEFKKKAGGQPGTGR
ncbi:MAG TPA: transposase [Verrucomicrobiae bacterium]